MKEIDLFIEKLNKITNELEDLGREFSDLNKQYDGNDFENQQYLANGKLDNSMHVATHEMATTIGFMCADIKILTDFIDFRKVVGKFTDQELEIIIDNPNIPLTFKLDLAKKLTDGNSKKLLEKIQATQNLWNKMFQNNSYKHLKTKFS